MLCPARSAMDADWVTQDRTLRKHLVNVFSEWDRWCVGLNASVPCMDCEIDIP